MVYGTTLDNILPPFLAGHAMNMNADSNAPRAVVLSMYAEALCSSWVNIPEYLICQDNSCIGSDQSSLSHK